MVRYAIVRGSVVENVVLWDGETDWTPPDGCDLIALKDSQTVGPGDTYDGKTFAAEQTPTDEPLTVTLTADPDAFAALTAQAATATTAAKQLKVIQALLALLNPN